jgi:endonuclease/exonuclease/phosphatase family metal-dependent hydrolase
MPSPENLAVASYNIHKGVGTDRRRDLDRTAAVIAEIGADILALQEVDTRFGTRTGLLDLESIRRDLGLTAIPLGNTGPAHGWHGNLLLVRNALVQQVHKLVLPGLEPRGAIVTDLEISGHPLRVVNTHLGLLPGSRAAQARAILNKVAMLPDRPTLLMGDLNEWWRNAAVFRTLAEQFAIPAPQPSFPTRFPLLPYDRIMSCRKGILQDMVPHDSTLSRKASDHLPVKARFRFLPPDGTEN